MKKRILSFALVLCFVLTLLPTAFADSAPTSGECGENLTWELKDGTLTISGTGDMDDYFNGGPWCAKRSATEKVVIGSGVTSIGRAAFYGCENLTSVIIPDSVTSIGEDAFNRCFKLPSLTIPKSVKTIGDTAFYDCESLTSLTIPEGVASIGEWTFCGCDSLKSVKIPNSVTSIGEIAFSGCKSLTSVTIPKSVTSIGRSAFNNCESLTSVVIPDGVKSIEEYTFNSCRNLTSVTIPKSVTSIGEAAFGWCNSLNTVNYGGSVKQWKAINVADDNWSLLNAELYCTDGNGSCGDDLTWKFDKNGTLTISGKGAMDNYSWGYTPWNSKASSIKKVVIGSGVTSIGTLAFCDCDSLTSVTIGNDVTSIGDYAFRWCNKLTSVTMGKGVKSIGNGAFQGCESLKNITIPNSVKSIGEYAFYYCVDLATASIPNSVSKISYGTFWSCDSLKSVTIPTGVKTIDVKAFNDCGSLSDVYYKGSSTQWKAISIKADNTPLKKAAIHYYAISAPELKITTSAGHPKIYWNSVDGAAKYWIYRSTDGKNFKYYDSTTKTSYTNGSTNVGTTYYYKVKAVKVVNGKSYTSDFSISKGIQCKPAAPTVSINRSNGKPKLTWKAVSGATKYWIYRSTDGVNFKYFDSTTKTSYTNSGAASGKKYYYRVKAVAVVKGKNVISANSSTKSLMTTLATPSVSITTSNGKPKLTWKAVTGADKYYVYRSTDGKTFKYWDSTTKTSYTNSGATKNTKYYYKVKAVCASNSYANSAQSSTVSIKATK